MLRDQRERRLGVERQAARETLEQHHARGVEVAARVELFSREVLGRHVVRGADRHPVLGQPLVLRPVRESGDAEVHHLEHAARLDHHVLGLDVAVDHSLLVRDFERPAQLFPDRERDGHRQRTAGADELLQGCPLHVFHREVVHPVHLAQIVRAHHVAMGDLAGEPDLLLEALERDAAPHERFGTERLDRHRLLQLAVERPVHHTHPAHPEDLLHLVAVGEQRARAQPASRRGTDGRAGALELLRGRGPRRGHHVLDELRLLLQVRHQTLERLRQHADLVAGGDADFHAVVPVLHPARRERQPADRARDLAGQHGGRGQREQQSEREGEPDRVLQHPIGFSLALGLLLALATAYVLARQIAGPIRRLALATRRVQDGDYSVEIGVPSGDEIGMLSQAFQSLVADLKEKAKLVEYMMATSGAAPTEQLKSTRPSIGAATGSGLRPGTLFANRYEVKEVLGMGGMGVVYRAFDRELQEAVAIKALRPEALVGSGVALERFKQEIRLARKITHRNVVRTYDLGEVNGMYYLTMEYVEGTSLKQLISTRGPLPVSVTLTIGKQLCRALEVAHEEGVIHRDIKPQNMVVEPSGVLKVMDFGIARLANRSKDEGLTKDGMSIGTPDYMSPEHLSGKELDARSDLYSAGVVLFECLTRRLPFDAETTFALIAKHLEEEPPDPRTVNPDVPEALAQVILKAMAKEPADRYQTAVQMHDALAAIG